MRQGLNKLVQLVRSYFRLDGHHIQFNVVDADTLRLAQKNPAEYRDLIVRVAGYSDYFCDLSTVPAGGDHHPHRTPGILGTKQTALSSVYYV